MTADITVLVAIADTHAGSKYGLMAPDVELLDDTGPEARVWSPSQTRIQQLVWDYYAEKIDEVADIAKRAKKLVVVHNGDITQGIRYPSDCISTRMADQCAIALHNLLPWYNLRRLSTMCLVHGTSSHEFGEGSAPIVIAGELAKRYKKVRTITPRHGLLNVNGARVDISHHGVGPGARTWLRGNTLRYYTRSVMIAEIERGNVPPIALLRAHYHDGVRETVREGGYVCEAIAMPCLSGFSHYAAQVTNSAYLMSYGLTTLVFEGERLSRVYEMWQTLDLRQEETV